MKRMMIINLSKCGVVNGKCFVDYSQDLKLNTKIKHLAIYMIMLIDISPSNPWNAAVYTKTMRLIQIEALRVVGH